jgi:hypothetical protein
MEHVVVSRADDRCEAGGIATRVDARAHAVRCADAGEDVEAWIGGIGNEIECRDFVTQTVFIASRDAVSSSARRGVVRIVHRRNAQDIGKPFNASASMRRKQPNAEGALNISQ